MEKIRLQSLVANLLGIGICVVVLAAIFFPVFAQSRGGSRRSCLSNVKQLGLGLLMYQEDYDGRFPRAAEWMDATYPYIKSDVIYRCTSIDSAHKTEFGYAFNSALELKPLAKQVIPAHVVVVYDSNDLHWNANALGRAGAANPPRHYGGDVFGFGDGHAKFLKLTGADN